MDSDISRALSRTELCDGRQAARTNRLGLVT